GNFGEWHRAEGREVGSDVGEISQQVRTAESDECDRLAGGGEGVDQLGKIAAQGNIAGICIDRGESGHYVRVAARIGRGRGHRRVQLLDVGGSETVFQLLRKRRAFVG